VKLTNISRIICLLCFISFFPAHAADLTGEARIIDGDTIWIGKTKIRLHGIDAPEMRQECRQQDGSAYSCGVASTYALRILIGSEPVRCEGNTYDRYRRLIAVCYSETVNLNAELVRQGWALAYRRYSKEYVSAEKEAQNNKRGMWVGEFDPPWKWRRK
jgi:endonuclease YncB( thermonuclease family)